MYLKFIKVFIVKIVNYLDLFQIIRVKFKANDV